MCRGSCRESWAEGVGEYGIEGRLREIRGLPSVGVRAVEFWRDGMLKGVLIGLLILVLVVFAYVGYSSYATGRAAGGETYTDGVSGGRAKLNVKAEPTGSQSAVSGLSSMPTTGDANGMVAQNGGTATSGMAAPAQDSIAPNPPNGMTFGGSGHYQLYRQGDLTWRLNTDNGQTCVIFATDEEWQKPKVFRAGCRGK